MKLLSSGCMQRHHTERKEEEKEGWRQRHVNLYRCLHWKGNTQETQDCFKCHFIILISGFLFLLCFKFICFTVEVCQLLAIWPKWQGTAGRLLLWRTCTAWTHFPGSFTAKKHILCTCFGSWTSIYIKYTEYCYRQYEVKNNGSYSWNSDFICLKCS